jgi:hypothetical protein
MVWLRNPKPFTDLHPCTTATPRSVIIFMKRKVISHPERMCSVFNQGILICWNLGKKHAIIEIQLTEKEFKSN